MASKDVMVVTEDDIKEKLQIGAHEIETLKFLVAHAGIEMDEGAKQEFIAQRNAKNEGFRELVEVQKWMEKTAASIKAAL